MIRKIFSKCPAEVARQVIDLLHPSHLLVDSAIEIKSSICLCDSVKRCILAEINVVKKDVFYDKIIRQMASQSIDKKIIDIINRRRHGVILFASDFADMGEQKTINKVFERITLSGKIIRLARGIYCKPKVDTEFGLGIVYPSVDDVAQAIAQRDRCRIVPTGDAALNKLGLSTQVPMNAVYFTDGTSRRIKVYNGRGILFKRVVPKRLDFKSELVMLITFALQRLGQGNVSEEQLKRIKQLLSNEPKEKIAGDLKLVPGWIRSIILKAL